MNQRKEEKQPQMNTDTHRYGRSVILNDLSSEALAKEEVKDPESHTPAAILLDSSLRSE